MKAPTLQNQLADLEENGYALLDNPFQDGQIQKLLDALETIRKTSLSAPGVRQLLKVCPTVRAFATEHPLLAIISAVLGTDARPVRAILFDKSPAANWYVTWHQDLSIPVRHRVDLPGFGPWSTKEGIIHVQPPAEILEGMLSARIHLDDCDVENGPIKFIPSSHRAGILDHHSIGSWKMRGESVSCPAKRGDVVLMRPLILHSSSKSDHPSSRRVLHLEYANVSLPTGMEWAEA
jgi:ectoine hydroxylase-related dioxygenase (phytanoyl-CoA dioxygenase family)